MEEREGKLFGFECKWADKKIRAPKLWRQNYPDSTFEIIHPKYLSWREVPPRRDAVAILLKDNIRLLLPILIGIAMTIL